MVEGGKWMVDRKRKRREEGGETKSQGRGEENPAT
jgi:hypothetical protein